MGVLWYETAIGSRSFLCVFVCVVSANYKNQKQTAWISPPNSTHLILMRWLSAKPLLAWLSHRATAAPLCVCFLVPYLPHGQNMALAFTQTKCLQSIAMSASVELMISHKPKQLFLSLADLKAATPSFLLSSVAHISLIANKMIRNLCARVLCKTLHLCVPSVYGPLPGFPPSQSPIKYSGHFCSVRL